MTDEDLGTAQSSADDGPGGGENASGAEGDDERTRPQATETSDDGPSTVRRARVRLTHLRTHSRAHRLALAVAMAVGLALAWVHWLGLLVGGALVGVVAPDFRRALLTAVGFGVLVLFVFALTLGSSLGKALAMTPPSYLAVGSALGLPAFGSLVRALG